MLNLVICLFILLMNKNWFATVALETSQNLTLNIMGFQEHRFTNKTANKQWNKNEKTKLIKRSMFFYLCGCAANAIHGSCQLHILRLIVSYMFSYLYFLLFDSLWAGVKRCSHQSPLNVEIHEERSQFIRLECLHDRNSANIPTVCQASLINWCLCKLPAVLNASWGQRWTCKHDKFQNKSMSEGILSSEYLNSIRFIHCKGFN